MSERSKEHLDRELRLGAARLKEHWLNQAEESFRRVLASEPDHPSALHLMGVTLSKLGQHREACALLRRAADLRSGNQAVLLDLGVALRDAGEAEQAQEVYGLLNGGDGAARPAGNLPLLEVQTFSVEQGQYVFKLVDYSYEAKLRYGAANPPHRELAALIEAGRDLYASSIRDLATMRDDFQGIPVQGDYSSAVPFWLNTWFPPLDAMMLQGFLKKSDPRLFLEIGSGMSTKFARRAVETHGLRTRIVSIDPQPRNIIDRICDQTVRAPLEKCPSTLFDTLESGDILFLDSSHRSFQNSDVTVFFLEILPRVKPGVIVHIHDIYLPFDYPSGHIRRLWNEQYLLATALLFGRNSFEILMPCWYATQDADLSAQINGSLRQESLVDLSLHGASFWLRKL